MKQLFPDQRESRLPLWASEILSRLRQEIESLERAAAAQAAENERLRIVIAGKYSGGTEADTFYVNDDTAQEIPLGKGPTIRVGGFFDVRYDAGKGALLVEGDRAVQVYPESDYEVAVAPRQVKKDE